MADIKLEGKNYLGVNKVVLPTVQGGSAEFSYGTYNIYSIAVSVVNGYYSGATQILDGNSATVFLGANSGYQLPSLISVSGADNYDYDSSTGIVILSNPTGNITISAVCELPPAPVGNLYLSFIEMDKNQSTLSMKGYDSAGDETGPFWDGTMEYSLDGTNWTVWDGTEISTNLGAIYLRGTNNTTCNSNIKLTFTNASMVEVQGNIETLLDYATVGNGGHPVMADFCFSDFFGNNTYITAAPSLPATTLSAGCYQGMFYRCSQLLTPPSLPATTLTRNCYYQMFNYSGITSLPAIRATIFDENSCYRMFNKCTSLQISETQDATYTNVYRIPVEGEAIDYSSGQALTEMFRSTGGSFKGTPNINSTYYTPNNIIN